eukprot:CAMPEP_0168565676 /NCGR_PEP_ID=MMETSP0413-20121227/13985_1 /TAXON_ID=136452 /ORGANISM="Filamoeba nolandi, Strain NC-AS-23-1" /LENGTH=322 /DNA_ID=CAMNT_0008597589 /DNA_START=130 /DNA_END=1095 /DNA_ORIENTATION=+
MRHPNDEHLLATHLVLTPEEVSKHNSVNDGWIIINQSVYEVSKFIDLHPGGVEILLPFLGKDATEAFKGSDLHAHSLRAWKMLKNYRIGHIGSEVSAKGDDVYGEKKLVDMNKAILPQVMKMKPEFYQDWLHGAATCTPTIRIFEMDFFEAFTRWPWWYIFPLWMPVILYFLVSSCLNSSILANAVAFPAGLLVWATIEYLIHRYLFHMQTSSLIGNYYHFFAHGIHHLTPMDPSRLTFPPMFSIPLVYSVYRAIIPWQSALPCIEGAFAGGLLGYVMYDAMHYYFHHGDMFKNWKFMQRMKKRHLLHHFSNEDKNFGVSSP